MIDLYNMFVLIVHKELNGDALTSITSSLYGGSRQNVRAGYEMLSFSSKRECVVTGGWRNFRKHSAS